MTNLTVAEPAQPNEDGFDIDLPLDDADESSADYEVEETDEEDNE